MNFLSLLQHVSLSFQFLPGNELHRIRHMTESCISKTARIERLFCKRQLVVFIGIKYPVAIRVTSNSNAMSIIVIRIAQLHNDWVSMFWPLFPIVMHSPSQNIACKTGTTCVKTAAFPFAQ